MTERRDPNPDCRDCYGSGWVEVGEGWGAENVPCACTEPAPSDDAVRRQGGNDAYTQFVSIAQIIDDYLAAGIAVRYVKMRWTDRDFLVRQRAKKRKRPPLPGMEASVLGVPVVGDDGIGRPFIVITDENQ